jgi:ribosomal protein S6
MSILVPDMADEETQAAIDRISGYITGATGEITQTLVDSPWGRRRLAYTMRFNSVDYRDGVYVLTRFSASPNAINEIERDLKLDTSVIRYLLVMDDPKTGEQTSNQDAVETETPDASESAASASASPAGDAVAQESNSPAAGTTPEAGETTAPQQHQPETTIEETAAEVADQIEGEENPAPADAPEDAAQRTGPRKLPTEGEGESWVAGDGTRNVPDGFPIKGNASSRIFHPKESPSYENTVAEIYFASNEAAEQHGYRLPKTMQQVGATAANSAADLAQSAIDAAGSDSEEG